MSGQTVNFDQSDAGRAILARDDRGVGAGTEIGDDRRFQRVVRRDAGLLDGQLLLVFPVVVREQDRAVAVAEFERGVRERVGAAGVLKEGPIARTRTFRWLFAPPRIKPPMRTFSADWTLPRVLILAS